MPSASLFSLSLTLANQTVPPPQKTHKQLTEGKVVAVGPGRRAALSGEVIPVSVKEGDTVLLPEYGGTPLNHEGKELLLYRDDELLGVLH